MVMTPGQGHTRREANKRAKINIESSINFQKQHSTLINHSPWNKTKTKETHTRNAHIPCESVSKISAHVLTSKWILLTYVFLPSYNTGDNITYDEMKVKRIFFIHFFAKLELIIATET